MAITRAQRRKGATPGPLVWVRRGKRERKAYLLDDSRSTSCLVQWVSDRHVEMVIPSDVRRDSQRTKESPESSEDESSDGAKKPARRRTRKRKAPPTSRTRASTRRKRVATVLRSLEGATSSEESEEEDTDESEEEEQTEESEEEEEDSDQEKSEPEGLEGETAIEDSKEEDSDEENIEPERKENTSEDTPRTPPPSAKKRTKNFFSPEEDQAILSGIEHCGKGNWKEIKSTAGDALESRTPTQIKDRHRTLTKSDPKPPQQADTHSVPHLSPAKQTPQREGSRRLVESASRSVEGNSEYYYPDRACFDAALEVYNRKQLNGPNQVKPRCRVFVRREVEGYHVTNCSECGASFEEGMDYLVEFRPWLSHKLCVACMYQHLDDVVGKEPKNVYDQLRALRASQSYPVAGHLQKHLHPMGIKDMVAHRDAQKNKTLDSCTCKQCKCDCSVCWSRKKLYVSE